MTELILDVLLIVATGGGLLYGGFRWIQKIDRNTGATSSMQAILFNGEFPLGIT